MGTLYFGRKLALMLADAITKIQQLRQELRAIAAVALSSKN